jgi:hypothetical protein
MKGEKTILGNNQSWQSWLHNCKEAWATEGVNCSMYAKDCHNALVAVEKKPGDSRVKIAAKAWALHQEWKKQGKW